MAEIAEVDTTKEEAPSANGWQSFEDDAAFLSHILAQEPAEELVEVPEWHARVLCRELDAESRLKIEMKAYDKQDKSTDYRRAFSLAVVSGCYNPATGNKLFKEEHEQNLSKRGGPVVRLALTILRISGMLGSNEGERAKKN